MKRKAITLIMTLMLVFCVPFTDMGDNAYAYTNKTRDQAIAWVQSNVGRGIDWDGAYGAQCVDLIMAYYNALGVSPSSGNGRDYATNALPSGWTRVQNGTPQKGDILVYGASSSNPYGHVAIYESDYTTYHQNFNGNYVEKVTGISYKGFTNPYWGYIRPDWNTNREPQAYLDISSGGTGTIRIAGWAFDPDSPGTSIAVHVYIGAPATTGEGHAITADQSREDVNSHFGIPGNHGFDATIPTNMTGTQTIYVYAIDTAGGNNPQFATATVNIAKDTTSPVVSDIQVTNITSSGYTISCKVTDSGSGVSRVQFPTWTTSSGQDDLVSTWWSNTSVSGTRSGDTYTFKVRSSAHNYEKGEYVTDIYAWDNSGNESGCAGRRIVIVPCANHKSLTVRNAKDATCTENGYTGDTYCTDCGSLVEKGSDISATGHKWGEGVVTKEATAAEEGSKTYTCTVCNATRTEAIPVIAHTDSGSSSGAAPAQNASAAAGASAASADMAIRSMTSDTDPAGSRFSILNLRSTKQKSKTITLKWRKSGKAVKYVVYGNKCGKNNKPKKLATVTGKNTITIKKVAGKKLKKGTYYKFMVVAIDRSNNVVSTTKMIHVATKGGKVGNHKSVKVKKSVVKKGAKLKKGKTLKLNAKAVKASSKKVKKHVGLRYESTNARIASVSKNGVVKGKKKGTCYIYAYAQSGVYKKIKVVVK